MHIAKYTRSAAGHMLAHYDRAKDKNDIGGSFINRRDEVKRVREHKERPQGVVAD